MLAFSLLTAADVATGQAFSRDGNRWYEVEISIFRHTAMPTDHPEATLPERVEPGYPERIRRLRTPLDALAFDFSADDEPAATREAPARGFNPRQSDPRETLTTGPAPALTDSDFKLPDPVNDPFLHIEERAGQFDDHNQRLRRSGEHRLLYHAVWRQPVLNRPQAEAVLITGGDRYAEHHELEGSVMLSFNVNRIDVDARLWVATFSRDDSRDDTRNERRRREALSRRDNGSSGGGAASGTTFALPPLPLQSAGPAGVASRDAADTGQRSPASSFPPSRSESVTRQEEAYRVTELGYMEQRRSMISNQLHYLDHPDFGVLVEVRPYLLPDPLETE